MAQHLQQDRETRMRELRRVDITLDSAVSQISGIIEALVED
jgi:hypothetical protein